MSNPKQRRSRTHTRRPRRAHNRARILDDSSSPLPAQKRRPVRHENPRDQVYAIKDIVNEKFVNGERWYQIDWADDPATGQSFEPTWEPEENANQEAVDDWECHQAQRNSPCPSDRSPSIQEDCSIDNWDSACIHSESAPVYVELQSKSDFLKSRPDINPAEVVAFTSSQLSEFPHSDSDSQLPPSQFFIVSSQPFQNIVIADSQPVTIFSAHSQQAAPCVKGKAISQTTIPDSQDFSTDLSQEPIEVPCTIEKADGIDISSPKASHHTTSVSSIPSRQPDGNLVSFGNFSVSTNLEPTKESQDHTAAPHPTLSLLPPLLSESSRVPFSGFLTQLEFDSGEFSLSNRSRQESQLDEAVNTTDDHLHIATAHCTVLLDDSHQPAQRILPVHEEESQFLTQSQPEVFSASAENESVPATSVRNPGASRQLEPSQHAVLPATRSHSHLHHK